MQSRSRNCEDQWNGDKWRRYNSSSFY